MKALLLLMVCHLGMSILALDIPADSCPKLITSSGGKRRSCFISIMSWNVPKNQEGIASSWNGAVTHCPVRFGEKVS